MLSLLLYYYYQIYYVNNNIMNGNEKISIHCLLFHSVLQEMNDGYSSIEDCGFVDLKAHVWRVHLTASEGFTAIHSYTSIRYICKLTVDCFMCRTFQ